MFRYPVSAVVLLVLAGIAPAELKIDPIYASHMILQRGCNVPITGTSSSSAAVTVRYGEQTVNAKVKGKKWRAVLRPMEADARGKSLEVRQGKDKVVLDDVLVGEVWLASGQSNMLFRLDQTGDKAAMQQDIAALRFYHAEPQVHTDRAAYDAELLTRLKENRMYLGSWLTCTPGSFDRMSAVGWYFGRKLHELLGVPVGIVHTSLGGSEMMAWMPHSVVKKKYKDCMTPRWLDSKYMSAWVRGRARLNIGKDSAAPHPYKPSYLFETGITPWLHFPFAGIIWYQGESDAEIQDQEQNEELLMNLITGWRAEFKKQNIPFIMVQLPRIKDDSTGIRRYWPEFREVQDRVAEKLPHVYDVTTVDLGSTDTNVHPPRKIEVGERLAAVAAAKVYNKDDIEFSGPVAVSASAVGDGVAVEFTHAEGLKSSDGKSIAHFELSSDGRKYLPSTAEVTDGKVMLKTAQLHGTPKYVRYAWSTFLTPNLVNAAGLPAVPFTLQIGKPAK